MHLSSHLDKEWNHWFLHSNFLVLLMFASLLATSTKNWAFGVHIQISLYWDFEVFRYVKTQKESKSIFRKYINKIEVQSNYSIVGRFKLWVQNIDYRTTGTMVSTCNFNYSDQTSNSNWNYYGNMLKLTSEILMTLRQCVNSQLLIPT